MQSLSGYKTYGLAIAGLVYAAIGFLIMPQIAPSFALSATQAMTIASIALGTLGLRGALATEVQNILAALGIVTPTTDKQRLLATLGRDALARLAGKARNAAGVILGIGFTLQALKIGALVVGTGLILGGCALFGSAPSAQDYADLNAAGQAVKASMDTTIATCIQTASPLAICTANKAQIKAGAQGLTAAFDTTSSLTTSTDIAALLVTVAAGGAAYEKIVTDLDSARASAARKRVSVLDIITIAGQAIPVIEAIYQAFTGGSSGDAAALTATVEGIDADNATIQAW